MRRAAFKPGTEAASYLFVVAVVLALFHVCTRGVVEVSDGMRDAVPYLHPQFGRQGSVWPVPYT